MNAKKIAKALGANKIIKLKNKPKGPTDLSYLAYKNNKTNHPIRIDKIGTQLKYFDQTVKIELNSHVPTKYLIVDTETGDLWQYNNDVKTIKEADLNVIFAAKKILNKEK